jgi:hypothetical protein
VTEIERWTGELLLTAWWSAIRSQSLCIHPEIVVVLPFVSAQRRERKESGDRRVKEGVLGAKKVFCSNSY